jgi:hypothetical protein
MRATRTERLAAFADTYGATVLAALEVYADHMRAEATKATQAGDYLAEHPQPEPEAGEGYVIVAPTAHGWTMMGQAFGQAADRADAAHRAMLALDEDEGR